MLPIVLGLPCTTFRKVNLSPSSGIKFRTWLGPLERARLSLCSDTERLNLRNVRLLECGVCLKARDTLVQSKN